MFWLYGDMIKLKLKREDRRDWFAGHWSGAMLKTADYTNCGQFLTSHIFLGI